MILGIAGAAGAGKNAAADILISQYNFVQTSFAEQLYLEVANAFNVTVDYLSNRETKETPLAPLALKNCTDPEFVKAVINSDSLDSYPGQLEEEMNKPRSPRWVLQRWGTEYRRNQDQDYWKNKTEGKINALGGNSANIVLTDTRFENEVELIINMGGRIMHIDRDVPQILQHASAQKISRRNEDLIVDNNRGLTELEATLESIIGPLVTKSLKRSPG